MMNILFRWFVKIFIKQINERDQKLLDEIEATQFPQVNEIVQIKKELEEEILTENIFEPAGAVKQKDRLNMMSDIGKLSVMDEFDSLERIFRNYKRYAAQMSLRGALKSELHEQMRGQAKMCGMILRLFRKSKMFIPKED